jgi:hypothetical protein
MIESGNLFLSENNVPQLSNEEKEQCDEPLTEKELKNSV